MSGAGWLCTSALACALAGAGELLASRTVRDLSAGSGLTFESLGPQRLKGLPEEVDVYRVTTPASTYALLSIAESLLIGQQTRPPGPDPAGAAGPQVLSGTVSERDAANMHVNQHFAWSRQGFESP